MDRTLHDGTADHGDWQAAPLGVRCIEFLTPWLLAAAAVGLLAWVTA